MKITYKLVKRANGDRAILRCKRGIFSAKTDYYSYYTGGFTPEPRWYTAYHAELDKVLNNLCNYGELKTLKSCGDE